MCYYIGARKKETKKEPRSSSNQDEGGTVPRSKYSDPNERRNPIGNTPTVNGGMVQRKP